MAKGLGGGIEREVGMKWPPWSNVGVPCNNERERQRERPVPGTKENSGIPRGKRGGKSNELYSNPNTCVLNKATGHVLKFIHKLAY